MMVSERISQSQWVHTGNRVMLVAQLEDLVMEVGDTVKPNVCSREENFESGGIIGDAWGLFFGSSGKPNYNGTWYVLSAPPEQVIDFNIRGHIVYLQKVAADSPDEVDCRVEFCGTWYEAMEFTREGRLAYINHFCDDSCRQEVDFGQVSSADDKHDLIINESDCGSANTTGFRGCLSLNNGRNGIATNTGWYGAAISTGNFSSAVTSGISGFANNTGPFGVAVNTGLGGAASSSGKGGTATNTNKDGAASSTGEYGIATNSRKTSSVSNIGFGGIAALTGEDGTIEVGPNSIGVVTANSFFWKVRKGAVIAARWLENEGGPWQQTFLCADHLNLKEKDYVKVVDGQVVTKV